MLVKWVPQSPRQRRPAAGRGRAARRQRRPQALLGGDLPVRHRREERRARAGRPSARWCRGGERGAGRAADQPGAEPRAPGSGVRPFSAEQGRDLAADAFYARMSRSSTRGASTPPLAYEETLAALVEQLETRVGSVDNGEVYMKQTKDAVVPMPEGPKIFETVGPWEDYATPSRDMRLIIAMNVLPGLPERIVQAPRAVRAGRAQAGRARKQDIGRACTTSCTRERSHRVQAHRRFTAAADGGRHARPQGGLRDGLQPQRLRRDALGRQRGHARRWPPASAARPPTSGRAWSEYRSWFRDARRPPR